MIKEGKSSEQLFEINFSGVSFTTSTTRGILAANCNKVPAEQVFDVGNMKGMDEMINFSKNLVKQTPAHQKEYETVIDDPRFRESSPPGEGFKKPVAWLLRQVLRDRMSLKTTS
jgi:hypothetical protein